MVFVGKPHIDRTSGKPNITRGADGSSVTLTPRGTPGPKGDTGAPGGSDAAFAGWVDDPASQTRASLSAAYAAISQGQRADLGKAAQGTLVDDFTDVTRYRVDAGGTLTGGDTSQAGKGMPVAMKMVTAGAGATVGIERDLFLDGRGKVFTFDVLCDSQSQQIDFGVAVNQSSYFTTSFARNSILQAGTYGTSTRILRPNVKHTVSIPISMLGTNGSSPPTEAMLKDVRTFRIAFKDKAAGASTFYLSNFRVHDAALDPGIIWVFDDGIYSQYSEAFPILQAAGFVGSVAVVPAYVAANGGDVVSGKARVSWANLVEMQNAGWEHVNHTQNHTNLKGITAGAVQTEIRSGRANMITNGLSAVGASYLVYPGGQFDEVSLPIAKEHCRVSRTIENSTTGANGHNYESPMVGEPERLRTAYFTRTTTVATGTAIIDRLAARGGHSIFTFHGIEDTNPTNDDFTNLTADFQTLVTAATDAGLKSYVFSDLWPH